MEDNLISLYTDGSCNPEYEIGAWAVILFVSDEKIVLSGTEKQTTHQRMELTAVIKAFDYLAHLRLVGLPIQIFTDSQYVADIPRRSGRLKSKSYLTKSGSPLHNADLLKVLIEYIERLTVTFIKVKAHQRDVPAANHEVDVLSRKLVRKLVMEVKRKMN